MQPELMQYGGWVHIVVYVCSHLVLEVPMFVVYSSQSPDHFSEDSALFSPAYMQGYDILEMAIQGCVQFD